MLFVPSAFENHLQESHFREPFLWFKRAPLSFSMLDFVTARLLLLLIALHCFFPQSVAASVAGDRLALGLQVARHYNLSLCTLQMSTPPHTHTFSRTLRPPPRTANCTLRNLETLTSLQRAFFLTNNSLWSFPSVSSLSDYSTCRL